MANGDTLDDNGNDGTGDDGDTGRPSKTRKKKEMLRLQALGERLVALPDSRLKKVPLEDDLRTAIDQARGIRSHEGRRRQLQYVGRLMRSADAAAIEASLAGDDVDHARQVAAHHAAEQWRDGLIDGSRQVTQFIARFPAGGTLTIEAASITIWTGAGAGAGAGGAAGGAPARGSETASAAGPAERTASAASPAGSRPDSEAPAARGTGQPSATGLEQATAAARAAALADPPNPRPARALYRALHQWLLAADRGQP